MAKTELTQFRIVYLFDLPCADEAKGQNQIADLRTVLSQVQSLARHIPKRWSMNKDERDFLAELHENVTLHGRTAVSFGADKEVTSAQQARYTELLADVVQSKCFRKWILDSGSVACAHGFGGTRESVLAQLQDLQEQNEAATPLIRPKG